MPPMLAFMPYFVLIALSFGAQVGPVKEAVSGLRLALDYPGFTTGQGFTVAPADNYAAIGLLAHTPRRSSSSRRRSARPCTLRRSDGAAGSCPVR